MKIDGFTYLIPNNIPPFLKNKPYYYYYYYYCTLLLLDINMNDLLSAVSGEIKDLLKLCQNCTNLLSNENRGGTQILINYLGGLPKEHPNKI